MPEPVPRFSLADVLETLAPFLPAALVSPAALAGVRASAERLPAALTDRLYLETRLEAGAPSVDLSFDTGAAGSAILAGRNPAIPFPPALAGSASGARLRDLYGAFTDPSTVLGRHGRQVLLEFDVAPGAAALPAPGVFVGLKQAVPPVRAARFAGSFLACLLGGPVPRPVRTQLHAALAVLPAGAGLSYVGFLPARPRRAVRLCIGGLTVAAAFDYVAALGGSGASLHLRDRWPGTPGPETASLLHVDVWDTVLPRVGMEFCLARPPQEAGRLIERAWLDRLVEAGLCTPEKCRALAAWPGRTAVPFPHVFWPTVLHRRVNHVKLVWTPDAVSAKAYLFAVVAARTGRRVVTAPVSAS